MTNEDWEEIKVLRQVFMGTRKGIALGNLIAEKQRLDQIKQIIDSEVERGDCVLHCDLVSQIKKVLGKE